MNDFIFQNTTKVYFGKNLLGHLPEEVLRFGRRVLLVYGGGSIRKTGLYDKITGLLKDAGVSIYELGGVEPNPRHMTVNKGARICREERIDLIVAAGGGSVIDCAKGIAATAMAKTDDVWDLVEKKEEITAALPIIAVLTTAATGSETDNGGVITNLDKNMKLGMHSEFTFPKVAFENPETTYSWSAYQTACGSFDIMSHIFDCEYFSRPGLSMDMLKRVQEEVLSTVIKYAPVAIARPDDYEARANLMWASSWALNGFLYCNVGNMTACHAMEHELSAYYDITHGHGLAILTPRWLEHVLSEETAPVIRRFGVRCLGVDPSLPEMEGARAAIEGLKDFCFNKLGLKSRLSDLGIDDTHFKAMARHACDWYGGTLRSFTELTPADVEAIYRRCL